MISFIYHTGLTPPPPMEIDAFEICYYPMLKVEYGSRNMPNDINDFLQLNPIVLIMSKNAVLGLGKWLSRFDLELNFFSNANFWTVGNRTHACLSTTLNIQSFYPNDMTGKGVLQALQKQKHSRVLLVSSQDPQHEFIEGLYSAGINFFHFPVYTITCNGNAKFSDHFKNDALNYLIITSPSSIDGILKSLSLLDLSGLKSRIISIGPTTSAAIRKNGGHVFLEAENQNINALYENLANLIDGTSLA